MKAKTILPLVALALCSCGGATGAKSSDAKISEESAFKECTKLIFEFMSTSRGYDCTVTNVRTAPKRLYDYIWLWDLNRYDGDEPIDVNWSFTTRCNVDSVGVTFFHSFDGRVTHIIWAR